MVPSFLGVCRFFGFPFFILQSFFSFSGWLSDAGFWGCSDAGSSQEAVVFSPSLWPVFPLPLLAIYIFFPPW